MSDSNRAKSWRKATLGLAVLSAIAVSACRPQPAMPPAPVVPGPQALLSELHNAPPQDGAPGCWHHEERPAVFETVTEQVMVTGADGQASYRTEVNQRLLRPRDTVWFRTPCPEDGVGDIAFIATLQRALKARGMFDGAVSGSDDDETRAGVQRFQRAQGLDSAVLSLTAAQMLGVVASGIPR